MFVHDGVVYQVSNHIIQYKVNHNNSSSGLGLLIDGGANGGLSASDVRVMKLSMAELT
jgi:hypothetical protein